jgi:hypothetical protein
MREIKLPRPQKPPSQADANCPERKPRFKFMQALRERRCAKLKQELAIVDRELAGINEKRLHLARAREWAKEYSSSELVLPIKMPPDLAPLKKEALGAVLEIFPKHMLAAVAGMAPVVYLLSGQSTASKTGTISVMGALAAILSLFGTKREVEFRTPRFLAHLQKRIDEGKRDIERKRESLMAKLGRARKNDDKEDKNEKNS